jgi:hypothetical protein
LHVLAQTNPSYASSLCVAITRQPDECLPPYLSSFLTVVRAHDAERAITIARDAVATGDGRLCEAVAAAYSYQEWVETAQEVEIELLRSLASHPNPHVRWQVIRSAQALGKQQPMSAIDLLLGIDIGDSPELADELCSCFDTHWNLSMDLLTDAQIDVLLEKLLVVNDIGEHDANQFLNQAVCRRPRQVITFLLARIAFAETQQGNLFKPLPTIGFRDPLNNLNTIEEYTSLLRIVRNSILGGTWKTRKWIPLLFKEVSLNYSSASIEILLEWVQTGDEEKVTLAACLVRDAPRDFVLSHVPFVVDLLQHASGISEECYRQVIGYLKQSAISGSEIGVPGQPMPREATLKDQAHQIANRLQIGSPEYTFYKELETYAAASIRDQLARDEEIEDE